MNLFFVQSELAFINMPTFLLFFFTFYVSIQVFFMHNLMICITLKQATHLVTNSFSCKRLFASFVVCIVNPDHFNFDIFC